MTVKISTLVRNSFGNLLNDLIDSGSMMPVGYIEIRTGGPPATPDLPAPGTLLVKIDLPAGGFGTFTNGRAVISSIIASLAIVSDGLAGYFRIYNRDSAPIMDGSVGVLNSGADLTFDRIDFIAGGSISITNFALTIPENC